MTRRASTIIAAAVSAALSAGTAWAQGVDPHAGHSMTGMAGMEQMRMAPTRKPATESLAGARATPAHASGASGMDHAAHGAPPPAMGGMHMGHGGTGGDDALAASSPTKDAVLAGSPARLRLVFKSPVRLETLQLFDSTGSRVPIAIAPGEGAQVSAHLPTLPPDAYEARWRASDPGGAMLTGVLRFRVS